MKLIDLSLVVMVVGWILGLLSVLTSSWGFSEKLLGAAIWLLITGIMALTVGVDSSDEY